MFDHLITESFLSIERPYFNIDLSLYFIQYVDKAIVQRQLRGRVLFLRRIRKDLEALKINVKPSQKHLTLILDHDLDLVEAEIKSLAQFITLSKSSK